MNVKAEITPLAKNVQAPAAVIMFVEVGLEIPNDGGEVHIGIVLGASAGAKPLPETVTIVPTGPEEGFRVIVGTGAVTKIDAEAERVGKSCTVTEYKPGATLAITNEAVRVLKVAIFVHDVVIIAGLGVTNEQLAAALAKPVPVTVTVVPGGPEMGLKEIVGGRTWNATEAESPPGLAVAVTV